MTAEKMSIFDDNGKQMLEPGAFRVFAGGSQPDARSEALTGQKVLSADFIVK